MKIILINKYFYLKGGSERVFFNQAEIFRRRGHEVFSFSMQDDRNFPSDESEYFINNIDYERSGSMKEIITRTGKILYSFEAARKLSSLVEFRKPQIAHLHNIHHQISPSVISVLKKRKIPMVMTLHDYKMVCPAYTLSRNGIICERCRHGRYYHCFFGRCTKNSRAKSLVNTIEMYLHHSVMRIYNQVNLFISPSRFLAEKMKGMGFLGKVVCIPNPIKSNEYEPVYGSTGSKICYFGRLSREKGVFTLIEAVKDLDCSLKIIGDGPIRAELEAGVRRNGQDNIRFIGYKSGAELKREISESLAVIVPSEWYDNYPSVIMESFALGKPVIGAEIGGIPEMVRNYKTGLTFKAGDVDDLHSKIRILLENRDLAVILGKEARSFVELNLSPEEHYRKLMDIYQRVGEGFGQ